MLPFFWYMLKVIICSGILFGYYWLFLRNKIFHQYNRFYLLASISLSLLLPLLKINFWQPVVESNQAIRVLQAVSAGDEYMNNIVITAQKTSWSLEQLYPMIYLVISLVFFFIMLRTLLLIRSLLKKHPLQQVEDIAFVNTDDNSTPFSFFKYIFWNSNIDINTTTGRQIFKHEVAHIQEKHTHDKLFLNIVLIFCWCNPFFWLYRKELNMIHEFIADKKAVEDSDTSAFAAMILQAAYPKQRFELTNNFFYSPIKRRLLMLTKNANPKVNYIGRIMVLPLAVLIFAAFTFKTKKNDPVYNGKKITVVIDAGHGGQDAGAQSADGIFEKDLTLAIARKVKELNTNDAVEIILVRDKDVYLNVNEKVELAKSKNADLFISFHVNSGPKESANKSTGMSCTVAKDEFSNAGQSKVLASAIVNEFNNNYGLPVMQQLKQPNMGVATLQNNKCAAVLIEAGFINNDKDRAYLQTDAAKTTIARNVLAAIDKYVTSKPAYKNIIDTVPALSKQQWDEAVRERSVPVNIEIKDARYANALYVIDGVIKDKNFNLNSINPDDISSIDVLKGALAVNSYGKNGKDGVIIIKTKKLQQTISDEADTENALYVVNGKIMGKGKEANTGIDKIIAEKVYVKWLKKPEAIAKYGKMGVDGACEINYTNGEITYTTDKLKNINNDANLNQEPILYLGSVGGGRLQSDYLKSVKEINMTTGYRFVSGTIYFEGPGFDKNVVQVTLSSNSLSAAANYFDRCKDGAKIVFDDVKFTDKNGVTKSMTNPPVFLVGSNNISQSIVAGKKLEVVEVQKEKEALMFKSSDLNKTKADKPVEITVTGYPLEKNKVREQPIEADQNNIIFVKTEISPMFTGGEPAWRNYLQKNLNVLTPLNEGWKAGRYTVMVKFIVHSDGTVSDVTTENYAGTKTAQHCIDVIKNAPKWQAAIQNGKKVNAYKKQPITFLIEE